MKLAPLYCDSCKKECRKACHPVATRTLCTACHTTLSIYNKLRLADGSVIIVEKNYVPTPEKLFEEISSGDLSWCKDLKQVGIETAKKFAKLHVEAALKAACEKATCSVVPGSNGYVQTVDKNSILNSYPIENIK
jgi:hypothetical protein